MAKRKKKKAKKKAKRKTKKKAKRRTSKARGKGRKTTSRKRTTKRGKKKTKAKRKTKRKKKKSKRKPNKAFMKPMTPSEALSAIVGKKALPRTQVTKKIWQYIKKHKLQDKTRRIMINADEKLRKVLGGKRKVSMFEMTKWVNKHLKD